MTDVQGDLLRIQYVPLSETKLWDRNAKKHDIPLMAKSFSQHGFRDAPIYDVNLGIAAGNGRIATLLHMKSENMEPPLGIGIDANGEWYVPIQFGIDSDSKAAAESFAVDHNNLTMAGAGEAFSAIDISAMWEFDQYLSLLEELEEGNNLPISLDMKSLAELQRFLLDDGKSGKDNYSRKIEAPIYEPSDKKPEISELFDDSITQKLIAEIEESAWLSDEEREFLIAASQRHTVLNFAKIADFYAHSDAKTQRLMENSALIIIDFEKAIELGFIEFTQKIAEIMKEDYPDA